MVVLSKLSTKLFNCAKPKVSSCHTGHLSFVPIQNMAIHISQTFELDLVNIRLAPKPSNLSDDFWEVANSRTKDERGISKDSELGSNQSNR